MSETNENGGGLTAMLGDALVEDTIEADLLLRYGHDPEALEPAERERVERYLDASPAHRQQLRSLVRFAETRAGLVRDDGPAPDGGAGGGAVVEIASHPRWRPQAAWIGGAIAASLVAALLYFGSGEGFRPDVDPGAQLADKDASRDEALISPSPVEPNVERPPEPQTRPKAGGFAQGDGTDAAPPEGTPPTPSGTAGTPLLADKAPVAPSAPAPQTETVQPIAPKAGSDQDATREPLFLAMNVSGPLRYAPPEDAIDLAPLGGLRNAGSGLPVLEALAPTHVARTLSSSPTLYWYLSEKVDRAVELALADRVSVDPILEVTLEPPISAGIHALNLAEHGIALDAGQEYRWFVSLTSDEPTPSEDLVARGALIRVPQSRELAEALEAAPIGERGRIYAEHGLWYDALDFISRSIERAPEDAHLRELRADLLERGRLSEAAYYERRAAARNVAP